MKKQLLTLAVMGTLVAGGAVKAADGLNLDNFYVGGGLGMSDVPFEGVELGQKEADYMAAKLKENTATAENNHPTDAVPDTATARALTNVFSGTVKLTGSTTKGFAQQMFVGYNIRDKLVALEVGYANYAPATFNMDLHASENLPILPNETPEQTEARKSQDEEYAKDHTDRHEIVKKDEHKKHRFIDDITDMSLAIRAKQQGLNAVLVLRSPVRSGLNIYGKAGTQYNIAALTATADAKPIEAKVDNYWTFIYAAGLNYALNEHLSAQVQATFTSKLGEISAALTDTIDPTAPDKKVAYPVPNTSLYTVGLQYNF